MIRPGTRQLVARVIAKHVDALLRPQPIVPMPSPWIAGGLLRKQAE